MKSSDRRIKRTQLKLRKALGELILEKDYCDISVRDITDKAGISYATFFRHYDTKESLLADSFHATVSQLQSLLSCSGERPPQEEGQLIFEHIASNIALYKALLDNRDTYLIVEQLEERVTQELVMFYARYTPNTPTILIANHTVTSIIGMIKWWIHNDMPYTAEQMGYFYETIIIGPIGKLLEENGTSDD